MTRLVTLRIFIFSKVTPQIVVVPLIVSSFPSIGLNDLFPNFFKVSCEMADIFEPGS